MESGFCRSRLLLRGCCNNLFYPGKRIKPGCGNTAALWRNSGLAVSQKMLYNREGKMKEKYNSDKLSEKSAKRGRSLFQRGLSPLGEIV